LPKVALDPNGGSPIWACQSGNLANRHPEKRPKDVCWHESAVFFGRMTVKKFG
jgi:hypothetical protein